VSNLFQDLAELPVRRAIQVLRNKVADVSAKLDAPGFFDQYPGKPVPWCFSRLYTVELLNPSTTDPREVEPEGGPIQVGRDGAFFWCETHAFVFGQRNVGTPNRSLFDSFVVGGGGVHVPNIQGPLAINNTNLDWSFVCAEVELYDRRRGRSITNGRIPLTTFAGGSAGPRRWRQPVRWDPDTEIDAKVFVTEAFVPTAPTANNRFFLSLTFKGFMVLQEVTGRETILAGEDDGETP
jgi:hypothetical protein